MSIFPSCHYAASDIVGSIQQFIESANSIDKCVLMFFGLFSFLKNVP
jgi:hypothetical protein